MLELLLPEFSLSISPIERVIEGTGGPYLDWLKLSITLETPGISANFQWEVMPSELQSFFQALESINSQPLLESDAILKSIECGFQLEVHNKGDGRLILSYCLQPTPPDGPKLTGITGTDQSYLPNMITSIHQLISFH